MWYPSFYPDFRSQTSLCDRVLVSFGPFRSGLWRTSLINYSHHSSRFHSGPSFSHLSTYRNSLQSGINRINAEFLSRRSRKVTITLRRIIFSLQPWIGLSLSKVFEWIRPFSAWQGTTSKRTLVYGVGTSQKISFMVAHSSRKTAKPEHLNQCNTLSSRLYLQTKSAQFTVRPAKAV